MSVKENPLAFAVVGCAMKVHTMLGTGFLEAVYGDALEIELRKNGISFEREKELRVFYDGKQLKTFYKADFVCENKLIVELKAIKALGKNELAQVRNYLKATKLPFGLLLNFATPSLQHNYIISPFYRKCAAVASINRKESEVK